MSKFKVWIDIASSTNVQSADTFAADSQRQQGFKAGTGASAIRVNTALRQANLIAVALVDALGISDSYSPSSSLTDMTNWFKGLNLLKLADLFSVGTENTLNASVQPLTNKVNLGTAKNAFNSIFATTFTGALEGVAKSSVISENANGINAKQSTAPTTKRSLGLTYELDGNNIDGIKAALGATDLGYIEFCKNIWFDTNGQVIPHTGSVFVNEANLNFSMDADKFYVFEFELFISGFGKIIERRTMKNGYAVNLWYTKGSSGDTFLTSKYISLQFNRNSSTGKASLTGGCGSNKVTVSGGNLNIANEADSSIKLHRISVVTQGLYKN